MEILVLLFIAAGGAALVLNVARPVRGRGWPMGAGTHGHLWHTPSDPQAPHFDRRG